MDSFMYIQFGPIFCYVPTFFTQIRPFWLFLVCLHVWLMPKLCSTRLCNGLLLIVNTQIFLEVTWLTYFISTTPQIWCFRYLSKCSLVFFWVLKVDFLMQFSKTEWTWWIEAIFSETRTWNFNQSQYLLWKLLVLSFREHINWNIRNQALENSGIHLSYNDVNVCIQRSVDDLLQALKGLLPNL